MFRTIPRVIALLGVILTLAPVVNVASSLAASIAGATTQNYLMMCNYKLTIKPSNYVVSCTDANANFVNMKWSTGRGTFQQSDCSPNCVAGKVNSYRASVNLRKLITTKHYGKLFSEAVFHYTLNGQKKSQLFGLAD